MDLKNGRTWAEFIWLRAKWQIFVNMVPLNASKTWLGEEILDSQEGLCSMELSNEHTGIEVCFRTSSV
jgi:hypothetical protein